MMRNEKNKSESPEANAIDSAASALGLGILGTTLAASNAASKYASCNPVPGYTESLRTEFDRFTSDCTDSGWGAPPYSKSVHISYADYIQMQNLFGKLEKFLDSQLDKPYKTNLEVIQSLNSKQLALFIIRDVKKILSGTDSAIEELEAWLNEAPDTSK